MIEIVFSGGLGVRLFQYMFARILCELKDDCLTFVECKDYKKNYEKTKHRTYESAETLKNIFPNIELNVTKKNNYINDPIIISGHTNNIKKLIDYKGKIILKGSGFQNFEYYKDHIDLINHMLFIPETYKKVLEKNSITLHYRLGDCTTEELKINVRHNEKYLGYHKAPNISPVYFIDILKNHNYTKVYIVTDDINHKHIKYIQDTIENTEIVSTNLYDDFLFMVSSPNLIICHSTYSWWAALISNSKKIYMPKTNFNTDIKYHAEWVYRNDINLNVNDDKRYIYM